jgi:hypothetical protein
MDGTDLQRRLGPISQGRSTRASLEALARRTDDSTAATGEDCLKLARRDAFVRDEGTPSLAQKVEKARRR